MLLVEEAYLLYRHVVDVICEPEVAGRFPLHRLSCNVVSGTRPMNKLLWRKLGCELRLAALQLRCSNCLCVCFCLFVKVAQYTLPPLNLLGVSVYTSWLLWNSKRAPTSRGCPWAQR